MALLGEHAESKNVVCKTSAIVGLGLAYVGSHREDLSSILLPFISDDSVSMEIASLSALALGFIFVGSSNGEITSTILQALMERTEDQLDEKWARFMTLGLALLYVGAYLFQYPNISHCTFLINTNAQANKKHLMPLSRH